MTLPIDLMLSIEEDRRVSWDCIKGISEQIILDNQDISELSEENFNDLILRSDNKIVEFKLYPEYDFGDFLPYAIIKHGHYHAQIGIEVNKDGSIASDNFFDEEAISTMDNYMRSFLHIVTINPNWENENPAAIVRFIKEY